MFALSPLVRLILASGSPRRREMLAALGLFPEIIIPNTEEYVLPGETPEAMVRRLALAKAHEVASGNRDAWVLGADTSVVIDGEILGKPAGAREAAAMLERIQGKRHEVVGGFALINLGQGYEEVQVDRTTVLMAPMDGAAIAAYVASGEPLDKAGSYAIQGFGAAFVTAIEGSYTNVVGLNVPAVTASLLRAGVARVNR